MKTNNNINDIKIALTEIMSDMSKRNDIDSNINNKIDNLFSGKTKSSTKKKTTKTTKTTKKTKTTKPKKIKKTKRSHNRINKNGGPSLNDRIATILKENGTSNIKDILSLLENSGWTTSSTSAYNVVAASIASDKKRFSRVSKGTYSINDEVGANMETKEDTNITPII